MSAKLSTDGVVFTIWSGLICIGGTTDQSVTTDCVFRQEERGEREQFIVIPDYYCDMSCQHSPCEIAFK